MVSLQKIDFFESCYLQGDREIHTPHQQTQNTFLYFKQP